MCASLPALLNPRGIALLVHSALCDADLTLSTLRAHVLKASVVQRHWIAFGPVLRDRAQWLIETGCMDHTQRWEELVVIRTDR
ncbi:hypothetical protein [Nocardia sp. CA-120079]|uniref:hypothetical protein n=1 Tax=Nocardia sp. CA-120079 TaxID=3239974 RepID=UPI003D97472D